MFLQIETMQPNWDGSYNKIMFLPLILIFAKAVSNFVSKSTCDRTFTPIRPFAQSKQLRWY